MLSNFRDDLATSKMEKSGGCFRYTKAMFLKHCYDSFDIVWDLKKVYQFFRKYNVDWIGREGLSPDTHEAYLTDLVNHFYKVILTSDLSI